MTPAERRDKALALVRDRRAAYIEVFGSEVGSAAVVRADLEQFCRMKESTFHPDARVHALMEGRREYALRVQDHLTLTDEELLMRYGGEKLIS